jgi:protein-disulfide isomerase
LKNLASPLFSALALATLLTAPLAISQPVPAAPAPQAGQAAPARTSDLGPVLPAPADPLPPANPKLFTAKSPTVDTVNAFLRAVWGYDSNRVYRVMEIQPTQAPGITRVVVFVTEKNQKDAKVQAATFFVTPDGNYAIGEGSVIVNFGAKPFAATRDTLRERADGAWRGAPSKDFELVEFADLQCPHCKDGQPIMDQIVHDFPKAHVVFQLFPLIDIHPSAFKAAAYATCAQQQSNEAFFQFISGVFETQDALTPQTDDTLLKAAAKRAGLDADKLASCAVTPTTIAQVNADIKLAEDAGINETPTLVINGRPLSLMNIPYDTLKTLIQYQATLDGVDSGATPATLAPHPPAPALSNLPQ